MIEKFIYCKEAITARVKLVRKLSLAEKLISYHHSSSDVVVLIHEMFSQCFLKRLNYILGRITHKTNYYHRPGY